MIQIFGTVQNPLAKLNSPYKDLEGGGLILFISNVIKMVIIAAGLFAFINLIFAGFQYISSNGDPKNTSAAWSKINMSLLGLVVIASSYAIAAILGWLLFGNATAILSPDIYGPGVQTQ